MEISYTCYFAKYNDELPDGSIEDKETVTFIFEFNTTDWIVQRIAYDFFNPVTAVHIEQPFHELKRLVGLSGNYIANINNVVPTLKIVSEDQLRLITKNNFLSGRITDNNLRKYGFNSLKELALLDCFFQVLFTTRKGSKDHNRNIYQSFIFPPEVEMND
ncbi:hypothetical protein ABE218_00300 [Bacillus smithii]|uniref:hypothetical protein n=1 Tax=Bacillus smithii TaxID=1479 RepID=UPI003D25CF75